MPPWRTSLARMRPPGSSLELFNLLEESPSLPALAAAAEKHGLYFSQERLQPSPIISLPDSFDAYLDRLDGRYRREMVRKMRNALRYFIPVTISKVGADDDLSAEMEDFFAMMREETDKAGFPHRGDGSPDAGDCPRRVRSRLAGPALHERGPGESRRLSELHL